MKNKRLLFLIAIVNTVSVLAVVYMVFNVPKNKADAHWPICQAYELVNCGADNNCSNDCTAAPFPFTFLMDQWVDEAMTAKIGICYIE